jgi:hypothetical protein
MKFKSSRRCRRQRAPEIKKVNWQLRPKYYPYALMPSEKKKRGIKGDGNAICDFLELELFTPIKQHRPGYLTM